MICKQCGTRNKSKTAQKCSYCGGPLKGYKFSLDLSLNYSDLAVMAEHFPQTRSYVGATVPTSLLIGMILSLIAAITLSVLHIPSTNHPILDQSMLDFGPQVPGQHLIRTFTIGNTNIGALNWIIRPPAHTPWLQIQPSSGILPGNHRQIETVTINTTGLASGPHPATLQIDFSNGNMLSVDTRMTVIENKLSLSINPEKLAFSNIVQREHSIQHLHLINTGNQTLNWNVAQSSLPTGISLSPQTSGNLPPLHSDNIDVIIDSNKLPLGPYQAFIPFTYGGSPITVALQATIMPHPTVPQLCVDPGIIDMGVIDAGMFPDMQRGMQMFNVSNCGTGALHWIASTTASWFTINYLSTVKPLFAGEMQLITLKYDISRLPEGSYQGNIVIQSRANTLTVPVKVVKQVSQPILCNVQPKLNFGTMLPNQLKMYSVQLQNCGEKALHWRIVSPIPSWLHPASPKDTLAAQRSEAIPFEVNTAGLSPATYSTVIHLTSDGGNADISVNIQVSMPSQCPSSSELDFEDVTQGTSNMRSLLLKNAGDQMLSWQITNPGASWVQTNPQQGDIPSRTTSQPIQVTVNTDMLAPNQSYKTTITFTCNGGKTATVLVRVNVLPHPQLCTMPSPLVPITLQQGNSGQTSFSVYNCISEGTLIWDIKSFTIKSIDGSDGSTPLINVYKQNDSVIIKTDATNSDVIAGSYTLHIAFSDQDMSSVDIPVTTTEAPRPCTTLASMTVQQGHTFETVIPIYNCGGDTLIWHVKDIKVTSSASTTNATPEPLYTQIDNDIDITLDAEANDKSPLPLGAYTLDITFQEPYNDVSIPVNIIPEPKLCATLIQPAALPVVTQLDSSATAIYQLTNCAGGSIAWDIASVTATPAISDNGIILDIHFTKSGDQTFITVNASLHADVLSSENIIWLLLLNTTFHRSEITITLASFTVDVEFYYNNGDMLSQSFPVNITAPNITPTPTPGITPTPTPTPDMTPSP